MGIYINQRSSPPIFLENAVHARSLPAFSPADLRVNERKDKLRKGLQRLGKAGNNVRLPIQRTPVVASSTVAWEYPPFYHMFQTIKFSKVLLGDCASSVSLSYTTGIAALVNLLWYSTVCDFPVFLEYPIVFKLFHLLDV